MGYFERKVGRLHAAAARNDVDGIKAEQKDTRTVFEGRRIAGVPVDARSSGHTALMVAARSGSRDALRYLLSQGADVHLRDPNGRSALSYAAEYGHRDIIADLLDKQAGVDDADKDGKTPLMYAAGNMRGNVVKFLVSRGALVNETCREGKTALMYAARKGDGVSLAALLDADADIDARNNKGETALMMAAWAEKKNTVMALVERGARTDFHRNEDGRDAASLTSSGEIRKLIVNAGTKAADTKLAELPAPAQAALPPPEPDPTPAAAPSLRDRIAAAMEREGLDPSQSEHWLPVGNAAIEHVAAGTDSPRALGNSFNFAARQYVTTSRNLLTGENLSAVQGPLENFPNQDMVAEAHAMLKKLGKTPPAWSRRMAL